MVLSDVSLHWSCQPKDCQADTLPQAYTRAEYMVNTL